MSAHDPTAHPDASGDGDDALPEAAREVYAEAEAPDPGPPEAHHPPHPPGTRAPEDYTDPPGHHRRGGTGPALDVGA